MTSIDTIIHLSSALLPALGALAFVLMYRRQSIQADLEERRLRQSHCQRADESQAQRLQAVAQVAAAYAPMIGGLFERLAAPETRDAPTAATDLSDEDLVHELDRRISERDWKHGNPFAGLDDLLERLWGEGVDIPQPRSVHEDTDPQINNVRVEVD